MSKAWWSGPILVLATLSVERSAPLFAQINPDQTTGSRIRPNQLIRGTSSDLIQGGTRRRGNLFHSFQDFNIERNRGAYFANPQGIDTIVSRVTGSSISNIDGTLGVLGPADLFLLNPNGIVFGLNARLDISGSFTASTANEFRFTDGLTFSASNPQAAPLLTVSVSPGAQLGRRATGNINNAGSLEIGQGRSLTLHGRNITHTGRLKAPSGQVNLFGQTIGVLDQAEVNVSGATRGGQVQIGTGDGSFTPKAQRTLIGPDTDIQANALHRGDGGFVNIEASQVAGVYGNITARGAELAESPSTGGTVEISSPEHLIFRGQVETSSSRGTPGTLTLASNQLTIANGQEGNGAGLRPTIAGSSLTEQILEAPLSQFDQTAPPTLFETGLEAQSGNSHLSLIANNDIAIANLTDNELQLAPGQGTISLFGDGNQDGTGIILADSQDTIFSNGRDISISGRSLRLGNINTQIPNQPLESLPIRQRQSGAVNLSASQNISTQNILTHGNGAAVSGGNITINAGRQISVNHINTGSRHIPGPENRSISVGSGGDIQLLSRGNINTQSLSSAAVGRSEKAPLRGGQGGDISLVSTAGSITTGSIDTSSQTDSVSGNIRGADGGQLTLKAKQNIQSGNISTQSLQRVESPSTQGALLGGNGGDVSIQSTGGNITVQAANASSASLADRNAVGGNGGMIEISSEAGNISLNESLDTFSLSTGDSGSGGNIIIDAQAGDIIGRAPVPEFGFELSQLRSFILSPTSPQGASAGDIALTAKNNLSNLELFPFATRREPGAIGLRGTDDLSLNRVFITNQITAAIPDEILSEELLSRFEGTQTSGAITISGAGNLTFREGVIDSGTLSRNDAGDINVESEGRITLDQRSAIQSGTGSSGQAGNIVVSAPQVTLKNESIISTASGFEGDGGAIVITTDKLRLFSGGEIFAFASGQGDGGEINIEVTSPAGIVLSGTNTSFAATTDNLGTAGNITVDSPRIIIRDGAEINVGTIAQGNAGTIEIKTDELLISQGGQILARTTEAGNGGSIRIQASDVVNLGTGVEDFSPVISVETDGTGTAGDITISTPVFNLSETAQITAAAFGTGGGGNINLRANQLNLGGVVGIFAETQGSAPAGTLTLQPYRSGSDLSINLNAGTRISASTSSQGPGGDLILAAPQSIEISGPGQLSVEASSRGDGGNIEVQTQQLTLRDGVRLSASTSGEGDAGDINLVANDLDILKGATIQTSTSGAGDAGTIKLNVSQNLLLDQGAIAASTSPGSTGKGGDINIDPIQTILRNSSLSVNSQGAGVGGNISLTSDQLSLEQNSNISAASASTDGGNIQLQINDLLRLEGASQISATAGIAGGDGDGGNININAGFIVASPDQTNLVLAEAFEGSGGNINISTNGIFGDRFLDISASSDLGVDGDVNIETPGTDPEKSLAQLPTTIIEPTLQIANACSVNHSGQSQFIATGRGGLPLMPRSHPTGIQPIANLETSRELTERIGNRQSQPIQVASLGNTIEIPGHLQEWLKAGHGAYRQTNYLQAVRHWTQAVQVLAQSQDPILYASTLSNLALGYHYLGDANKAQLALSTSEKVLTPKLQQKYPILHSQVLNTRAILSLAQGKPEAALADWQNVIQLNLGGTEQIQAQLNQAYALRTQGFFRQAQAKLTPIVQQLQKQSSSPEKAMALLLWGDLLRASGETKQAQLSLEQALSVAQSLPASGLSSVILLNLGHTVAQSTPQDALSHYQQALERAPNAIAQYRAQVSRFSMIASQDRATAQALWAHLLLQAQALPTTHETIYTQLYLVDNALQHEIANPPALMRFLEQIEAQANSLEDDLAQAYILGYKGRALQLSQQYREALASTHQALKLARRQQAPEAIYQWAWQLGRYRADQGDRTRALAAYREAVAALRSLRSDLAIASADMQFSFRDGVEPLYRQYVKLLLESDTSEKTLQQARTLIEELQLSELNDYFQDACTQSTPVVADQLDPNAAVIYPIILDDRIDVIVRIGSQPLRHYSSTIRSEQVNATIEALLRSLTTPFSSQQANNTRRLQQVYDWIIRPAAKDLAQSDIKTLVFVADGNLRTLPLGALHDGEQYLIERYSVALAPGLDLIAPQSQQTKAFKMLVGGISEAREGFPALPYVSQEVAHVTDQIPNHDRLLNQELTRDKLTRYLSTGTPDIVHLATHGEFGPSAEETFILTWDGKLSIEEMGTVLQNRQGSSAQPVDLLVLSACETATGDSRAVLGIAGMTLRSGVRSTLAGLWSLNDQATASFMGYFYQAISQANATKAEAFRQAQVALMKDPQFSAPYYWSPFVLVGNWQ